MVSREISPVGTTARVGSEESMHFAVRPEPSHACGRATSSAGLILSAARIGIGRTGRPRETTWSCRALTR